ncbi:MAG: hypothetical protein WA688_03495 [Thermoplasmata archaeon]
MTVSEEVEESRYGTFGWANDPEANRLELWEPPQRHRSPVRHVSMERAVLSADRDLPGRLSSDTSR